MVLSVCLEPEKFIRVVALTAKAVDHMAEEIPWSGLKLASSLVASCCVFLIAALVKQRRVCAWTSYNIYIRSNVCDYHFLWQKHKKHHITHRVGFCFGWFAYVNTWRIWNTDCRMLRRECLWIPLELWMIWFSVAVWGKCFVPFFQFNLPYLQYVYTLHLAFTKQSTIKEIKIHIYA